MKPSIHSLRLLALMTASIPCSYLSAQTPAPAEEVITLDALEVSEVPIEQNILPTSRPFNSVYGTGQNITDIPRNVTIISREQLSAIAIQDVRDFSKLTSSSYTRTNFGAPSNPDIRGQSADVFQNGMRERITSNGNGMPMDFSSVESVNIVKGPATPVQGASGYVGGFIDLVTKRPYFDKARGSASVTYGSFDKRTALIDYGAPISETTAYRLSYFAEDSGGYFDEEYRKTQSLYGAFTWRPTDTYELFVNATGTYTEYTENWGYNRPTQEMIDSGRYTTGISVRVPVAPVPGPFGNNVSPGNNSQNAAAVLGAGNPIVFGPTVPLRQRTRLLAPGDNSIARNFKVQAIQTIDSSPDLRIVNNNLFTYTRRETSSSYFYNERVDPSITLESRVEFQRKFDSWSFNAGAAARYSSVESSNYFSFEPANVWDLSLPRSDIDVRLSQDFLNLLNAGTVRRVPGSPGQFTRAGSEADSTAVSFGPFIQGDYNITDRLTLIAGGRVDFLKVRSKAPIFQNVSADESVALPNVNGSLSYKLNPSTTLYATYNYSENSTGALATGGGFSPSGTNKNNLSQPSHLYELGAKWSLLNNRLFISTAIYEQTRFNLPLIGPAQEFNYKGFEFEVNYQPNKNFYATFGYSATDATADTSGFEAIMLEFARLPGQVQASGLGAFNFAPASNVRIQGLPKHQFNALAAYKWDNGFGVSINGTLHSEVNNNWAGTIVIPWQFNIDTSLTYTHKNWDARLTILNVTDELNFAPPNPVYGNESILIEKPIRAELTLTYKF